MNLRNKRVTHKTFGEGIIVDQDESFITIDFDDDQKLFVYPDAFEEFITLKDHDVAKSLEKIISKRKAEKEALEEKREKERREQLREQRRKEKLKSLNIHESSQIVFWLNEEEQQSVFQDWEISTGKVQSGKNKGEPNRPARLGPYSASLLTVREDDESETNRRIVGIFMVDDMFSGDVGEDGMIPSHEEYRIELTDEEAEQMLFWNYYINKNYPHRMTWNSGKYRYLDNVWTAQILKDIMALKTDEDEIKHLESFLTYFCEMTALDVNDIPEPSGALKQS